ncbi:group II intron reverse transcriptase/maturase [Clostridium sp. CM028]|uniref:group II intron reverse transcriptase/maturase n=1 Tax=Clostridium sp. CM028 TaxID=2851575 RepID=UPI002163B6C5|nr:group II intron reverse transcriptase/maturase [Clostridium sp. CM028]
MKESLKLEKKQKLRNNEYYAMQPILDELYKKACSKNKFTNLMQYITSKENILLAYRNIKKNKGSATVGTDKLNIDFFKEMDNDEFVKYIQNKFKNYFPKSVRRVDIPKPNGKTRPLGIPCIDDRIMQQCIKQIIEPICEAKFHKHSYGFRPNRSTEHAIARCMSLMNQAKLHYVVDVDVKGFFDNVNHSKLKKQLWNMGIQDKNLISIIGKILKSEIQGIGIPTKGTPQGGIISPLLANVVLNELDWWISSQWETFVTKHKYSKPEHRYNAQKKTNLKEIWFVRYADDFKIFCRDAKTAQKIYNATRKWLEERLGLEISPDKSKITNLRKNYTEFLGFKLMVKPKKNKYVCQSRMCDKSVQKTINKLKEQIKIAQKKCIAKEISKLNSIILGSHNYYRCATNVVKNFGYINFLVTKTLEIRLRNYISDKPKLSETYKRLYGQYKGKIRTIQGMTIFPIYGCRTKVALCFNQVKCNYTEKGRKAIHVQLKGSSIKLIKYYLSTVHESQTTELSDNSISLIAGQQGMCYVTGEPLEIGNMECHHKMPKQLGGMDEYKNLVWLKMSAHKLIHCTLPTTIEKYLGLLSLDEKGLKRINSLRKQVGNSVI